MKIQRYGFNNARFLVKINNGKSLNDWYRCADVDPVIAKLEAENKQLIFDLMTFSKLVYDYLNFGNTTISWDELEEMAKNNIERMKALEE
jgi:hypothetical protein